MGEKEERLGLVLAAEFCKNTDSPMVMQFSEEEHHQFHQGLKTGFEAFNRRERLELRAELDPEVSCPVHAEARIEEKFLQSMTQDDVLDLLQTLGRSCGRDMGDLTMNGDVKSGDPFLGLLDGLSKKPDSEAKLLVKDRAELSVRFLPKDEWGSDRYALKWATRVALSRPSEDR